MGTEELDPIDHQIIELLSQNARRTMADIGEQVSLSASAVTRRIERLERTGVIAGYTVVVDHRKAGRPIQAFTGARLDKRLAPARPRQVPWRRNGQARLPTVQRKPGLLVARK